MRRVPALPSSLAILALGLAPGASAAPPAGPCVFDVRLAGRTMSATASQGCLWTRLNAECPAAAPCSFRVTSSGVGQPFSNELPGVVLRPDPDGLHARYECETAPCAVTFAAGEGRLDVKILRTRESVSGLAQARVSVPAPAAK